MDDDNVDLVGPDVGEQCLQCRPVHIAAREPAIVIASSGQHRALVVLAADVTDAQPASDPSIGRKERRRMEANTAAPLLIRLAPGRSSPSPFKSCMLGVNRMSTAGEKPTVDAISVWERARVQRGARLMTDSSSHLALGIADQFKKCRRDGTGSPAAPHLHPVQQQATRFKLIFAHCVGVSESAGPWSLG